ncbi:MAG TPA: AAA family ATPase [Thermodesulfobacteriota bacterium]|nr:AAA family ATPase [Thermodesulfobacteriota bacterium]
MNTRDFQKEIKLHIEARYPVLWLVSFEERRVEKILERLCEEMKFDYWTWSVSKGLSGGEGDKKKKERMGKEKILPAIEERIGRSEDEDNLFLLKDIAGYFLSHEFLRRFRDLPAQIDEHRSLNTICIVSPTLGEIPPELEEDIVVLELSLPDYDEIAELLASTYGHLIPETWHASTRSILYKSLQGLSMDNIKRVIRKAISLNNGKLNEDCIAYVQDEKQQIIKKQKIIDYYPHKETIEHIGGLDEIKNWFIEREHVFRLSKDKIETLGLDVPKGLLLIGVPGSGKSLCCKALAGIWNLPLLRLDVGRLFGSTVGESEKNIRKCIQLAEAVSPCILWIDEIDKAFGGVTGYQGDSGTQLRVFGTFVTWLQEKQKPVFVISTANEPKNLPPELWRKGRYDEVFFVDLPSLEEREEIYRIHLEKRVQNMNTLNLRELSRNSQGFTGAEIEQAVKDSVVTTFNAFHQGKTPRELEEKIDGLLTLEVTQETLLNSIRNITPLSVLKKEEVEELRTWSHQRARPASRSLFLQRAEALTDEEKRNIAIHEAGHSITMKHHFDTTPVFISLDNYRNASFFIPADEAMRTTFTKRDLENEIGVILGGMVAEDEVIGNDSKTLGASHDLRHATDIARRMVVEYGFGDKMSNKSLVGLGDYALTSGSEVLDDIQKILNNAMERTADIIAANRDVLGRLVDILMEKVLMNTETLNEFFAKNPISYTGLPKGGQPA